MTVQTKLPGAQRKYLRGLAHHLDPLVHVGRHGLTESLLASADEALDSHELIKVRFLDFKEHKKQLTAELEEHLRCETVGMIGHTAILFRQQRDPEKRKIRLPAR